MEGKVEFDFIDSQRLSPVMEMQLVQFRQGTSS
jgi:hypothetical protein